MGNRKKETGSAPQGKSPAESAHQGRQAKKYSVLATAAQIISAYLADAFESPETDTFFQPEQVRVFVVGLKKELEKSYPGWQAEYGAEVVARVDQLMGTSLNGIRALFTGVKEAI